MPNEIDGEGDFQDLPSSEPSYPVENFKEIIKMNEIFPIYMKEKKFNKEIIKLNKSFNEDLIKLDRNTSLNRSIKKIPQEVTPVDPDLEAMLKVIRDRNSQSKFDKVVDDLVIGEVERGLECGCIHCRANASSMLEWFLAE